MLRERYAARNLFEEIEGISLDMEPVLTALDKILDSDELFGTVKSDLSRRYPGTLVTGRSSTPVEVVMRKKFCGYASRQSENTLWDLPHQTYIYQSMDWKINAIAISSAFWKKRQ